MNLEDRLSDALSACADAIDPRPSDIASIESRVESRRRRRRRVGAGLTSVGIAAGVLIALGLPARGGDDERVKAGAARPGREPVRPGLTTTSSTGAAVRPTTTEPSRPSTTSVRRATVSPTPSVAPGAPPRPSTGPLIVAVNQDGSVVSLSGADGHIVRVLLGPRAAGERSAGIALAPDGRTAFVGRGTGACGGDILAVTTAGGPPTVVAQGSWPSVSADGTQLGYVSYVQGDCTNFAFNVLNLRSGFNRAKVGVYPLGAVVSDLAWAGNRYLVYQQTTPGRGTEVFSLDFDPGSTVVQGRRIGPGAPGLCWEKPGVADLGDATPVVVVGQVNCSEPSSSTYVLVVDARDGTVRHELFPVPFRLASLAAARGDKIVYVTDAGCLFFFPGKYPYGSFGCNVRGAALATSG